MWYNQDRIEKGVEVGIGECWGLGVFGGVLVAGGDAGAVAVKGDLQMELGYPGVTKVLTLTDSFLLINSEQMVYHISHEFKQLSLSSGYND